MLADGVDLVDRRCATQQRIGQRLHVGERHAVDGQRHQRRAAARDEAHHEVVLVRILKRAAMAPRPLDAGLVRNRVAASVSVVTSVGATWPYLNVDAPGRDAVAEDSLYRLRHGSARLASADDQHPPVGLQIIGDIADLQRVAATLHVPPDGDGRVYGAERRQDTDDAPSARSPSGSGRS